MGRGAAIASLAIAGFAISWASILILWSGLNPLLVSLWRTLLASLALTPQAVRELRRVKVELPMGLLTVGGLALAVHFMTWITSLYYTTVAMSVTIVSTYVIFTIPISLALKRGINELSILGAFMALAGVALMMYSSYGLGVGSLLGNLLALAGAVSGAVYFVVGELARARLSTAVYAAVVYALASLFTAPVALLLGVDPLRLDLRAFMMVLLIVVGPMLAGHTLLNYSLRYLPATVVSTATLIEPVGSTILAYIFLRQGVGVLEALAMVIVLAGVYLSIMGVTGSAQRGP
jgi:drug/metabolite transporter (DMT)-like permease